jgi:hypothetical protein
MSTLEVWKERANNVVRSFDGLACRWQDEHEYENFNDYIAAAEKTAANNQFVLVSIKADEALTVVFVVKTKSQPTVKQLTITVTLSELTVEEEFM